MVFLLFMTFYQVCINLSGGNGLRLDEVVLHVALEVEVGQLVLLLEVEELREAGVRVDLATVAGVLETLLADVRVDLLAHGSARHLDARGLAEELRELVADARGLHEARGLAVARGLLRLGLGLLGVLELAGNHLLKRLEVALHRGEEAVHLLKLGAELVELGGNRSLSEVSRVGSNRDGSIRRGGGVNASLLGTRLGRLGNDRVLKGSGGGGGRGRGLVSFRNSHHF